MANQPGNPLLELALERYKSSPGVKASWEVARQLGQGDVYVASISPERDATSPTAIPGSVVPESVLALPSPNGPVLAVFTDPDGPRKLPGDAPPNLSVRPQSALGAAQVAAAGQYAGLVINPGTETATVLPAEMLRVALPAGKTNSQAKEILNNPAPTPEHRAALIKALASGPVYTAVARSSLGKDQAPLFPVIPLDGSAPAQVAENTVLPADTPAAVIFGTSPAEIALIFDPDQWIPVPVRIGDVLNAVGKTANVTTMVVNPGGPTLQLPTQPPAPATGSAGAAPANVGTRVSGSAFSAGSLNLVDEVAPAEVAPAETPEPGPSTEPDAGTREGED